MTINDKRIEIILRQMLRKVRIEEVGDTELLPMEPFTHFKIDDINRQVTAAGRRRVAIRTPGTSYEQQRILARLRFTGTFRSAYRVEPQRKEIGVAATATGVAQVLSKRAGEF